MTDLVGRPVKPHASGDPFLRNAAREILKRHATFPRVKWEEAIEAIAETLAVAAKHLRPSLIATAEAAATHAKEVVRLKSEVETLHSRIRELEGLLGRARPYVFQYGDTDALVRTIDAALTQGDSTPSGETV